MTVVTFRAIALWRMGGVKDGHIACARCSPHLGMPHKHCYDNVLDLTFWAKQLFDPFANAVVRYCKRKEKLDDNLLIAQ